jgi:hypothetical protein
MDVSRALAQIAEIHQQISKGEVYRGYRSVPIALSGLIGLAAAWWQDPAAARQDPVAFAEYWAAVAAAAALVGASEIAFNYVVHDDVAARRRTRVVVGQFMPSMLGGAIIAVSFVYLNPSLVPLLPGLLAVCFGIGTFASRPYLPRAAVGVALFYYAAGLALLWKALSGDAPGPWWIGGTFGTGQVLAAIVLYWNLERVSAERE